MAQCKATAKSTGKRCTREAMENGVCYVHGGPTPKGIASPHFKTGEHSKYYFPHLPQRMKEDYLAILNDPKKIEHQNEIALLTTRLVDIMKRAEGNPARNWFAAITSFNRFKAANQGGDVTKAIAALTELEDVLQSGASEQGAWEEAYRVAEQLRRVKDSEHKRTADNESILRLEEATSLVQFMLRSVVAAVMAAGIPNEEKYAIRKRIQADFAQLSAGTNRSGVGDADE